MLAVEQLSGGASPEQLLSVSRDITEQRRLVEDLRELNDTLEAQVASRTLSLEIAHDALRQAQKLEAIGQLIGGVAHDFNNLLTVMRGSIDLLQRTGLSEEQRERCMEAISLTVTRATKLTGQLLAFARRQALKPEIFDVGGNVTAVIGMIETLATSQIAVEVRLPETSCWVNADPSQFDTALINIAVNARDAMDGEGTLMIDVRTVSEIPPLRSHTAIAGDFVAISVADTGPGIAAENLGRIFEPFFTTKGVGHGTGLGLSQVFGFAKQTGGEVQVETQLDMGTTVTLYLPASAGPKTRGCVVYAVIRLAPVTGTHVLVVEDNAEVGALAISTLE